jgi:hypothetical protein
MLSLRRFGFYGGAIKILRPCGRLARINLRRLTQENKAAENADGQQALIEEIAFLSTFQIYDLQPFQTQQPLKLESKTTKELTELRDFFSSMRKVLYDANEENCYFAASTWSFKSRGGQLPDPVEAEKPSLDSDGARDKKQ